MSNLREGLFRELSTSSDVLSYVSGTPIRIFWLVVPQKRAGGPPQMPAIVYQVANVERLVGYCGTLATIKSRVAIDCYSPDPDEAQALAKAVRVALVDFRGMLGGVIAVSAATIETEFDMQDMEPGLYRVAQSWEFWHSEE